MTRLSFTTAALMTALLLPATPGLADTLELTGIVRDFKRGDQSGGHPDFETAGKANRFAHVTGLVAGDLGQDGKPVYNPTRPVKDTIKNAASLAQWYRDVPGVNLSAPLTLTLSNDKQGAGGVYSYANNAFWPINGQMFGDQGLGKNFHFTLELKNNFTYRPGQKFTFIGDDDVWVYINNKQVIDLGGVHSAITGGVMLFDGKAFVQKECFSEGGEVKKVSTSMATELKNKWQTLGLEGSCPVKSGDLYIDLQLNSGLGDVLCTFDEAKVNVKTTGQLSLVTVRFADGTVQTFDRVSGNSGIFTGSGGYADKKIAGVWVKTVGETEGYGRYFGAEGTGGTECTLDFFFAERHTTQSNFRIDTSINLKPSISGTISPLYD